MTFWQKLVCNLAHWLYWVEVVRFPEGFADWEAHYECRTCGRKWTRKL